MASRVAVMNGHGMIHAGPTIQELMEAWSEFFMDYFIVENLDTKETVIGVVSETMPKILAWKRANQKYTIKKLDKPVAETLYGKSK